MFLQLILKKTIENSKNNFEKKTEKLFSKIYYYKFIINLGFSYIRLFHCDQLCTPSQL